MHKIDAAPSNKLLSIEVARGIAAVIVVLYHASRHFDKDIGFAAGKQIFQFGHAGVDFFFVISGFIILFVHGGDLGRPDRLVHYSLRRFTRIYPIYWVILGLTIALALWPGRHALPSAFDLAWAALLLPTTADPVVGVAWSLQHEIIFYVLFAVLILHRGTGMALLALWLGVILFSLFSGRTIAPTNFTSAFNLEFFLGMAVAQWLRNGTIPFARGVFLTGLTAFMAASGIEVLGYFDGYQPWARLVYGVPSALMILGLVEMERKGNMRLPAPLHGLGRASYSIYLFHLTGIGISYKLWTAAGMPNWAPIWLGFGLIVIAGIGGGVIVSTIVEYPLMRWIRHRLRRVEGNKH